MAVALPRTLPLITPYLVALEECVCTMLTEQGAGPLCSCGVYPGGIPAFDGCDDCGNGVCGMGYVRIATAFPYDIFPNPTLDPNCRREIAWQVEIGALRCMPTAHDGYALDQETLAEVWVGQMLDAQAIANAVMCCDLPVVSLGAYVPVGPDGGCVGGFWTAWIGM